MPIVRVFMGLILFPAEPHKRAQEYSPAWNQQVLNLVISSRLDACPAAISKACGAVLGHFAPRPHRRDGEFVETLAWRHDPPAVSPAPP